MLREYFIWAIVGTARMLDKYFWYIIAFLIIYNSLAYYFVKRWDGKLYDAASVGNVKDLEEALTHLPNVNVKKENDFTPLMVAACNNKPSVAAILLKHADCKVEEMDNRARTALLVACQFGATEVLKLLLEHGVVKTATDMDGNNALLIAAHCGHLDVVKLLLLHNFDAKWKNKDGLNPITAAIAMHSPALVGVPSNESSSRLAIISAILETGKFDMEMKNGSGWTALTKAAFRGHKDIVQLLVGCGANVNTHTSSGFTPLIAASQNGWLDIAQLLLDNGANPDAALIDGASSMIAASFGGYTELVQLFLRPDTYNAATIAKRLKQTYKRGSNPLMAACCKGYIDVVQVLVDAGCDIDHCNEDGWNTLMVAADRGFLGIVKLLVKKGAKVNVYNNKTFSPLMCACKSGYAEIVQCLLEAGAHANFASIISSLGAIVEKCERDEVAAASVHSMLEIKRLAKKSIAGFLPPLILAIGSNDIETGKLLVEHCEKQAQQENEKMKEKKNDSKQALLSDVHIHMTSVVPQFETLFQRARTLLSENGECLQASNSSRKNSTEHRGKKIEPTKIEAGSSSRSSSSVKYTVETAAATGDLSTRIDEYDTSVDSKVDGKDDTSGTANDDADDDEGGDDKDNDNDTDTDTDDTDSEDDENAEDQIDFIYECLQTPLIFSIYLGNAVLVDLLLKCHADVNKSNTDGSSAVMIAAFCGDANILRRVLEDRPQIEVWNDKGRTLTRISVCLLRNYQIGTLIRTYYRCFVVKPANALGGVLGWNTTTATIDNKATAVPKKAKED